MRKENSEVEIRNNYCIDEKYLYISAEGIKRKKDKKKKKKKRKRKKRKVNTRQY